MQNKYQGIRFIFTITAGRSGTKLLAQLLKSTLKIDATHEPAPRLNYVFRSFVRSPEAARNWLEAEKLPAILNGLQGKLYVETSHLFCKGFIEPAFEIGLRPDFIILHRPAREIAKSMYQLNVIPERTSTGRLVLLGPSDPGVLHLPNWLRYSDYQLCYWYALEIERRQNYYEKTLPEKYGTRVFRLNLTELTNWAFFQQLSQFILGSQPAILDKEVYDQVLSINQNPKISLMGKSQERSLPPDIESEEMELIDVLQKKPSFS